MASYLSRFSLASTLGSARGRMGEVNFLFYSNQIPSMPDGDLIDRIHALWYGNYRLLEAHHGYIQWLFPVFESGGMNFQSEPLTKEEARKIRHDMECAKRVVKSYRLMLDFYGIKLLDERTGAVARADNWRERYANLNRSGHNYLRINRILTSLGHLGFSRYKAPLVRHFEEEILQKGELPNARHSLLKFWRATLDVDSEAFRRKTLEMPEDREDSVYLRRLDEEQRQGRAVPAPPPPPPRPPIVPPLNIQGAPQGTGRGNGTTAPATPRSALRDPSTPRTPTPHRVHFRPDEKEAPPAGRPHMPYATRLALQAWARRKQRQRYRAGVRQRRRSRWFFERRQAWRMQWW